MPAMVTAAVMVPVTGDGDGDGDGNSAAAGDAHGDCTDDGDVSAYGHVEKWSRM